MKPSLRTLTAIALAGAALSLATPAHATTQDTPSPTNPAGTKSACFSLSGPLQLATEPADELVEALAELLGVDLGEEPVEKIITCWGAIPDDLLPKPPVPPTPYPHP
ncbi:hypothetical protein [Streptomyces sp. NPDC093225]|uniref:hypothetical protein n=1 Tax=Streptomyces sp. NPDC093225 TaxID=3366034 RepID=UPI0038194558